MQTIEKKVNNEMTSSDSNERKSDDYVYPLLSLIGPNSQAIALWSYEKHECIAVFAQRNPNLMQNLVDYATNNLDYNRKKQTIMMLMPGRLSPFNIKNVYNLIPGSACVILPKEKCQITVTVSQLKISFPLAINLTIPVQKLKHKIHKVRGIPVERQDILFQEQALENDHRLLEYPVRNGSKVYVMIQTHFDLLVNVETFWGMTYRLYVDPCSTGLDVVDTLLRRTISKHGLQDSSIHEYYLPFHNLMLKYNSKFVHWKYCLAYYEIRSGATLTLTTVAHQTQIKKQKITVVAENKEQYVIKVSQFDRWSVVAFILHGLTNVPIDFIKLFKDNARVDMLSMLGVIPEYVTIYMTAVMTYMDKGIMSGVPVRVNVGHGIIENLKISPNRRIFTIKRYLERKGVPNATVHEITIANKKLHENELIRNVLKDINYPLTLKLEKFHVYVHTSDRLIYKTHINTWQTIGQFKEKMEQRSGKNLNRSRIIVGGNDLEEEDSDILYEAGVSIGTSIFLKLCHNWTSFTISGNGWRIKVKVPVHPQASSIRSAIQEKRTIPKGCVNCILTFFYWFFLPRMAKPEAVNQKLKIMTRIPGAKEELSFVKSPRPDQANTFRTGEIHAADKSPDYKLPRQVEQSSVHHEIKPEYLTFEPGQLLDITKGKVRNSDKHSISSERAKMSLAKQRTLQWVKHVRHHVKTDRTNIFTDVQKQPFQT